jgi:predicted nucleic acid-binding protein
MPYAAALDANVLHPQTTVDLLLRLAERGLFRVVWSDRILDEVHHSLVRRRLDDVRIRRRIEMMKAAFPEAMVEDIAPHLGNVPAEVDADDHHVVAAALAGRADAVVTNNLTHCPAEHLAPLGLDVRSLDDFLLNQWTLDPATVVDALFEMEADRDRPPKTVAELLAALEPHAPSFAAAARAEGIR